MRLLLYALQIRPFGFILPQPPAGYKQRAHLASFRIFSPFPLAKNLQNAYTESTYLKG